MPPSPRLSLVVAMARNGVIGRDGDLPWRMSDDLKWFKEITLGKPIIMGRTTWDSLGRPLPSRTNIVLSRQALSLPKGVHLASSLEDAIAAAGEAEEACIIGGASIYDLAMDHCDRLYITRIEADVEGDTLFKLPPYQEWQVTELHRLAQSDRNDYDAVIEQWDRREDITS